MSKEFDVASFNRRAKAAIKKIHQANKIPVVVGGSGLYMQILLDGIFKEGKKDDNLRKKLAREEGGTLYQRLHTIDPLAASKIHPHDRRRLIRSLEICLSKGKPLSSIRAKRHGLWGKYDIHVFVLNRERKELYARIDQRVEKMFRAGLVEEIRCLSGRKLSKTAGQGIGIREVAGFLNGDYDLDQAKYLMKRNTRHFAKRQLTWFRKDKRLQWIMLSQKVSSKSVADKIKKMIQN